MARVAITQDDHIETAIQEALNHLSIEQLIRGKIVAVKPNETWASEDDTTAVTQPDTLRALLRYVKRYRPRELVVTGGSGAAETDEIFRISGMMQVVRQENVEFFDHNRPPFTEVELAYRPDLDVEGPQKSIMVNPRVLEYETLIALNQLKVHKTATVTMSLKNIAMSFCAGDYYGHPRARQYRKHDMFADMHSYIAAMGKRFPIALAVTVGHPAMIGTGPIGGHTVETGLVIASPDPLAADVVGARLLGFDVQAVRHLWEAARLDVGISDTSKMEFPAMSLEQAIAAFTSAVYGKKLEISA